MGESSRRAVAAAIAGNSVITLAKFGGFLVSGSAAMLSETLHSLADTLNQVLLMVGLVKASREADGAFPFGYGAERHVWALLSAVGIFFLGCGVTVYHGINALLHPHPIEEIGLAVAILAVSFALEGSVLVIAYRGLRREAGGRPFLRFLRSQADPSAVAVLLEDSAACLGILLALGGLLLSKATGNQAWDAAASIAIGILLGLIAVWLIHRNRHLLVGPAIPPEARERIRSLLAAHPTVERVVLLRTRMLDTDTWGVTAEVDFAGEALAARLEEHLREAWENIETWEDFRAFAAKYAEEIMELLGDEVDTLEREIRRAVPRARYLDIEAD